MSSDEADSSRKLVYNMAIGERLKGIHVLGSEVMQPRGLLGLGQDTLAASQCEMIEVFSILAEPQSYPVLFHCTQGKDRTGLIAILVLLLCGVPVEAIDRDYRASEKELVSGRAERVKQMKEIGLGEEFAGCPEGFVQGIVEFLEQGWGGVEGYLGSVGVDEKMRKGVRDCLMVKS